MEERRFRRPVPRPEPGHSVPAGEQPDVFERRERARGTALAVLEAARRHPERALDLARLDDVLGPEELAELWADASDPDGPPDPGSALWTLYLLRSWCARRPVEVASLYAAGRQHVPPSDVVAGLPEPHGRDQVLDFADALLLGALRGDFGVALERGAAFCRVVAAGRHALADQSGQRAGLGSAEQNLRLAARLENAARRWRAGRSG